MKAPREGGNTERQGGLVPPLYQQQYPQLQLQPQPQL